MMIDQVVSGPVLAVRIIPPSSASSPASREHAAGEALMDGDADVVDAFRALCGPLNSELASKIRPGTLRADFGCIAPGGGKIFLWRVCFFVRILSAILSRKIHLLHLLRISPQFSPPLGTPSLRPMQPPATPRTPCTAAT